MVFALTAIVDSTTSGHDIRKLRGTPRIVLGETMLRRGLGFLRASSALGLLIIASTQANAGGFAPRAQSTYGDGVSFAGVAAGGALSSMFWNPATMTQVAGIVSETNVAGVFPFFSHTPVAGTFVPGFPGTSNVAGAAALLAGYTSYQLTPDLWLGVSINAPFGLVENFPDFWAGRNYAGDALLATYNAAPSIAYRINDWISIGAGVQIQYAKASLELGLPALAPPFGLNTQVTLRATGWAFGATAGVTLTPTPTTTIGLGWRSALNQKIEGELVSNILPPATTLGSASTTVNLPDIVSLGIRQRVDARWTLLGTVEWSNWSRIGTSNIMLPNGSPTTILGHPFAIPFEYRDGWFFSGGAEYIWSDRLTLRAGAGYDNSPVTDQVRVPLVPDNNRILASVGASWQVSKFMHFDVAYLHEWIKDAPINLSPTSGNPSFIAGPPPISYIGNAKGHADVISAALVVRFDELEPTARRPFLKY
jgi:long-chain fatty acid transport protein